MKYFRSILFIVSVFLFSMVGHHYTYAASKTDSLVNAAVSAGKVLYNLTTVENKATGKNVPTKEYNTAQQKYKSALAVVNKQTGKQKTANLAKLKDVKTKIDRGKKYIDGVNVGKTLLAKKATLDKYIKTGVMDTNTLNAYSSLSSALKSYSPKFTAVYGKKTEDKIKSLYKAPAEKVLSDLQYPVTVKKALVESDKLVKSSASSSKIAAQYKIIVFNLDLIKQSNYQRQLTEEVKRFNAAVPEKLKTGSFADLLTIETQFEQLDSLISKGKSNQQVPGIYENLKTEISKISSTSDRTLLNKRFTRIMDQLKVSIKELKETLTKTAIKYQIPPEILKSIAITENGNLQQFQSNGEVFTSNDHGYGIMQVTPASDEDQSYDWNRVKYDLSYNIETGVKILLEKWNYDFIPKVNDGNRNILENWYFAIMAYNGLSLKNDPNNPNSNAYQLKVYSNLKRGTLMDPEILSGIQMSMDPVTHSLTFNSNSYNTTKKTQSTQLLKTNRQIKISAKANFRTIPSTDNKTAKSFPAGTRVTILSGPIEDDSIANLFSWYKVSISGVKGVWYVASSNLQ